jgi:hypothetical protein
MGACALFLPVGYCLGLQLFIKFSLDTLCRKTP